MNKLLFILVLFLLNGCATTSTTTGYKQVMKTWIGRSEESLIRSRGTPNSMYITGDSKFLGYNQSYTSNKSYYSSYDFNSYGGSSYSTPIGGGTFSCKTTYEIINKVVVNIKWSGNNCKAKEKVVKPVDLKKIQQKSYDDYSF